jgi:hypothetical protein
MLQKLVITLVLSSLFFGQYANARDKKGKCEGELLVESDPAEVIEVYGRNVKVYLPLKVQVSNDLLDCADEIWIEPVTGNKIKLAGPGGNKTGKLKDEQFKRIAVKKGIWKTSLNNRNSQLWVKIAHYSLFPAGSYNGKVKVMAVSKNKIVEEQFVNLQYYSEPVISIELDSSSQQKVSGSNGDYQIDLGELVNNARFTWGINVLSNTAYDILLDSEYDGLRHETNRQALIEYTISFDNIEISSSEQLTKHYDFSTSVKNTWFGFTFELGKVELMPAGNYQDNVSFTISPR